MTKSAGRWAPMIGLLALVVWISIGSPAGASGAETVELAIVLDTSDSMDPLIDATRLALWDIVNELEVLDPPPRLRVALLTYGNSANEAASGWVRVEVPLTSDLDLVSQRLFQLETAGGAEYVGRALRTAARELAWTSEPGAVRLVFIAGNESAEQDKQVDLYEAARDALDKDLAVHAVFCGKAVHSDAVTWGTLAELTGGELSAIDHRSAALIVATPFDDEMAELGMALNQTYLPLGAAGREGQTAQRAQDDNASTMGPAASATRAQTKAGAFYAPAWDLLDALETGTVALHEIDADDLPAVMRHMTPLEQDQYLERQAEQRRDLRRQILELSAQRRDHVSGQIRAKGLEDSKTFDRVVRGAIRDRLGAGRSTEAAEPD